MGGDDWNLNFYWNHKISIVFDPCVFFKIKLLPSVCTPTFSFTIIFQKITIIIFYLLLLWLIWSFYYFNIFSQFIFYKFFPLKILVFPGIYEQKKLIWYRWKCNLFCNSVLQLFLLIEWEMREVFCENFRLNFLIIIGFDVVYGIF